MVDGFEAAAEDDFCYLCTRGRRTGRDHEIEIWFAVDGGTLYLLSGGGERADWVRNLRADPRVTVRVRDRTRPGRAHAVAARTDEDERARRLVYEKYEPRYGGDLTGWRARALAVAIDLDDQS
jgi:deazaflavin-dependent oxidoreductase (nitroreductase family)